MGLLSIFRRDEDTDKRSLESVTLDELRREQIRLEQEENKYIKRLERVERDKKELFLRGTSETSAKKQRVLARKIKQKDVEAKNLERNLKFFSKQLRIINGFMQLKENESILEQAGLSALVSKVDLQELESYVEGATVEGVFQMDRFSEILRRLEGPGEMESFDEEDEEEASIVQAMQEAAAARELDPSAAESIYSERLSGDTTAKDSEDEFI